MKKHFALYFTYIVNAMINAIEKHNGVPFQKSVHVFEHTKEDLRFRYAKTILISFFSVRSFFRYSIFVIQQGHVVKVQLFRSTKPLNVSADGLMNYVNSSAEVIASFCIGKEETWKSPTLIVPVIDMLCLSQNFSLNVPEERRADTVQTLILVANLFREGAEAIALVMPEFHKYESFEVGLSAEYPNIIEEAQKEQGMLDEVSLQTA